MYLHDRNNFTETISGPGAATRDDIHDKQVTAVSSESGEGGLKLTLEFGDGYGAVIAVAPTAANQLLAHDVLLEASLKGEKEFIGMKYVDVIEYEFPDSDFMSENDNNNAS
jgi:hypothetical protein